MDRHQFVEKLVGMRDGLKNEISELERKKEKAYNNSVYRLAKEIEEVKINDGKAGYTNLGTLAGIGTSAAFYGGYEEKSDLEKVLDEDVISICAEIVELRAKKEKVFEEYMKFNSRPIVAPKGL